MRRNKPAIFLLLSLISGLTYAAQEQFQLASSQLVVQVHDVNFLPGAADGTPVSAQMPAGGSQLFYCYLQNQTDTPWRYKDIGYRIDATPSGLTTSAIGGVSTPIYRLESVPGLGFALGFKEPTLCNDDFRATRESGKRISVCNSTQSAALNVSGQARLNIELTPYVIFYKIPAQGSPLAAGNQPSTVGETHVGSASLKAGDSAASSTEIAGQPSIFLSSFTVRYGSCAVNTGSTAIQVDMGKVSRSEFSGIGSTAGSAKRFQINVNCENSASVRVGFFGNASAADRNALALLAQNDAASGVGIALTYGNDLQQPAGTRIPLNTQDMPVLATLNGSNPSRTLEFQAQYIQTAQQVTAGKADSMATFTLIYN